MIPNHPCYTNTDFEGLQRNIPRPPLLLYVAKPHKLSFVKMLLVFFCLNPLLIPSDQSTADATEIYFPREASYPLDQSRLLLFSLMITIIMTYNTLSRERERSKRMGITDVVELIHGIVLGGSMPGSHNNFVTYGHAQALPNTPRNNPNLLNVCLSLQYYIATTHFHG